MIRRFLFVICHLSFVILFLLPSPALAATLSLSPTSGTFGKSCGFSVSVLLDTQAVETDGSDVILLYDPQKLSASSIVNGPIYSDFPGNTIDNSTGKVSIFALAPSTKGFTGKGTLASVNFTTTATASGSLANIRIDFDQNNLTKTTDSNVIQRSDLKDILGFTTDGEYTINPDATGCSPSATTTPIGGAADALPESGIWEPTVIVGGLGIIFTTLGVFGLKLKK